MENGVLGTGSVSTVSAHSADKAIKQFDKGFNMCLMAVETSAMKTLNHPNLGKTYVNDFTEVNPKEVNYIMTRYIGSLAGVRPVYSDERVSVIPPQIAKKILFQLLIALYNAEKMGIIHADVKPQNILVDKCWNIVLADWGISQYRTAKWDNYSDEIQTIVYRAPEVFAYLDYDYKIDIWSAALTYCNIMDTYPGYYTQVILDDLEVMVKLFGFPTKEDFPEAYEDLDEETVNTINKSLSGPNPIEGYISNLPDNSAKSLIAEMLQYNPAKRYNAVQCLNHEFFADLTKARFEERPRIRYLTEYRSLRYNFGSKHIFDTPGNRKITVDYVVKVVEQLRCDKAIIVCAIMVADYIRSSTKVHTNRIALLILSAIRLMGEFFTESIPIGDIRIISSKGYTKKDIKACTRVVYRKLDYNLYFLTPIIALRAIIQQLELFEDRDYSLSSKKILQNEGKDYTLPKRPISSKIKAKSDAILDLIINSMINPDYYKYSETAIAIAAITAIGIDIGEYFPINASAVELMNNSKAC